MGAGSSKVQVHVRADKPYYYTGDVVTGSVVFHTEQPITFHKINIKVTGVEKVSWEERHGSGKNSHTEHYRGKHQIFQIKLPIHNEGTLNPGDYQWPFSFQLPQNIPGSFNYHSGSTRASIEYKIKADCDQVGLLKPDFKKTIKIEVLQQHKAAAAPVNVAAEEPISIFCCFNKGLVGLRVTADTDSYMPGEQIGLRAQVDNKSTEAVPCVEFRVYQKARLTAKGTFSDHHKTFAVERVHQKQTTSGGPVGVPAAPGTVSEYAAVLALDRQLEATCNSKLIQSYYELEVRAKTGCCLSEVVVRQPIMLNDPQPVELPPAIMPPQDWAPQVYPMMQFSVPAPQGYDYGMPPMVPMGKPAQGEVPMVSVYQEGYPQGMGLQAPAVGAGWGAQPTAPMPGAVNNPATAYGTAY